MKKWIASYPTRGRCTVLIEAETFREAQAKADCGDIYMEVGSEYSWAGKTIVEFEDKRHD